MTQRTGSTAAEAVARTVALSWLPFAIIGVNACLEWRVLVIEPLSLADLVRLLTAATLIGFAPGILAIVLSRIAAAVEQRLFPRATRSVVFWAVPLAGLSCAACFGARGGGIPWPAAIGVVLALLAAALLAQWRLPSLGPPLPTRLAPITLWWLLSGIYIARVSVDRTIASSSLLLTLPALTGTASLLLYFAHRSLRKRRVGLLYLVTFWIFLGLAGVVLLLLQDWLVGLNLRLKTWVAITLSVLLWALFAPILEVAAHRWRRLVLASLIMPAIGAGGLVWMLCSDVPARFGPFNSRMIGGAIPALVSCLDDHDRDGFYAAAAGGNDCDDRNPMVNPVTPGRMACWNAASPPKRGERQRSAASADHAFIFIIDAVRGDLFDEGKRWRQRFPAIADAARTAVTFTRAYAPGNSTLISLPPMLSGISPIRIIRSIAASSDGYSVLLRGRWIFDLADERYCTAMIVQAHPYSGWLFEYYPVDVDVRVTDVKTDEASHGSAFAVGHFRKALSTCAGRPKLFVVYVDEPHIEPPGMHHSCADGTRGGFDCYLDEVAAADRAIGRMIALLRDQGLLDRSLAVITSDHGEAFGEHGHVAHTSSLYEEQARVPLFIRWPTVARRKVDRPVSLMGLPRTVGDALGFDTGRQSYPALTPTSESYPPPLIHNWVGHVKLGWASPTSAVVVGSQKLIYDWETTHVQLFELDRDPQERKSLPRKAQQILTDIFRPRIAAELGALP